MKCIYSGLVRGLLFAARAALLACIGGLAFLIRVCLWCIPALVSDCLCMPNHHVSLQHTLLPTFRAPGGLPGASVVAVGGVLLFLLSLLSGCGLMLLIRLHSGLFGALCVLPLQCAMGVSCRCWLLGALFVCSCSCVVGPHSLAGSLSWSVPCVTQRRNRGNIVCAVTPIPTIASLCNTLLPTTCGPCRRPMKLIMHTHALSWPTVNCVTMCCHNVLFS